MQPTIRDIISPLYYSDFSKLSFWSSDPIVGQSPYITSTYCSILPSNPRFHSLSTENRIKLREINYIIHSPHDKRVFLGHTPLQLILIATFFQLFICFAYTVGFLRSQLTVAIYIESWVMMIKIWLSIVSARFFTSSLWKLIPNLVFPRKKKKKLIWVGLRNKNPVLRLASTAIRHTKGF